MTRKIVPHDNQAYQRPIEIRSRLFRKSPIAEMAAPVTLGILRQRRKLVQDLSQLLLQPRMQDGIGRVFDGAYLDLSAGRMKQRQHFGGSPANIFVRLLSRIAFFLPTLPWLGNGLIGSSLVFTPDGNACGFA
jgi:hypothetical protein